MRKLLVLTAIAALTAAYAGANAQALFGFRLLKLDGGNVAWSAWEGELGFTKVSYAFADRKIDTPDAINCESIGSVDSLLKRSRLDRDAFRKEVRAAFDMWEAVANIKFTEVADPANAGILIGSQLEPGGRAYANVSYKAETKEPRSIERSLICLNPEQRWKIGFDGNLGVYDIRYTVAHEIGHAIGLDHPASAGQLMHYRYEERFRSLQPGDIEGAVLLYGVRKPAESAADAKFTTAAARDLKAP